jgi:plastocyanin
MRTHRLSLLGAVVVVVAAVSGGCGGYGGGSKTNAASTAASTGSSASSGGAVIKTVGVHETEYKLNPNTISLAKPGTYVFKGVNDGTTAHALAITGNGVDSSISAINPGSSGTLKVTLPKAGTYEIFCPIDGHKGLGMKGKVTVGGSGAAGGGTSTGSTNTGTTEPTTTYSTGY